MLLDPIQPTTEMGRRALGYSRGPIVRAREYFAGLMASPITSEMCNSARVVRLLQGSQKPTHEDLNWLSILTKSQDDERSQMAGIALGILVERVL